MMRRMRKSMLVPNEIKRLNQLGPARQFLGLRALRSQSVEQMF